MIYCVKKTVMFFLSSSIKKLCDLMQFYLIDSNWSMNIVIGIYKEGHSLETLRTWRNESKQTYELLWYE